jgi:hypothetical protein
MLGALILKFNPGLEFDVYVRGAAPSARRQSVLNTSIRL